MGIVNDIDNIIIPNNCIIIKNDSFHSVNSLSKEMGTKIAANEMSIENVSIRHRPMTISDDYRGFCTDAWHEAKIALDSKIKSSDQATEDSKIIFLEKLLTVRGRPFNNQGGWGRVFFKKNKFVWIFSEKNKIIWIFSENK